MPSRLGKWVHVIGERGVRAVQKDNLNNGKERGLGVATKFVEIDEAIFGGKELNQPSEWLGRASANGGRGLLCYAMLSWVSPATLRQIHCVREN